MSHARRLEGPRAPLFISLAIVAIGFAAAPLHAQSVDQEDLRRCAEMSAAERRLACFESLLDGSGLQPSATVEAAPAASARPMAAAAPAAEEKAVVAALPATESAQEPIVPARPGNDFGGEYVKESKEDDDRSDVTATVTEVTQDRYKRLKFGFANGQIWRQLEARRFQYPKDESFDVVISRGLLGDYQLRVGGEGRMTRIKRVK